MGHPIRDRINATISSEVRALTQRFQRNADGKIPANVVIRGVKVSQKSRHLLKTKIVAGSGLPTPGGIRSAMRKPGNRSNNHKFMRKHSSQERHAKMIDANLSTHRQIVELRELMELAPNRRLKDRIFKQIRELERSQ